MTMGRAFLCWSLALALGLPAAGRAAEPACEAVFHAAVRAPDEADVHADPAKPILALARGEFEPVAVTLKARRAVKNLRVACEILQGPGGASIAAENFRVHREVDAKLRVGPKDAKREETRAYWLVPDGVLPVDLDAGEAATFWITLHAPAEAAPGAYRGGCAVLAEGEPAQRLTWAVEVRPFALPKPRAAFAMFYTYEFRYLERYEPDYEPAAKRRDPRERAGFLARGEAVVRDLAEHGMTAIVPHSSRVLLRRNGRLEMPDLEASLRAARAHGMNDPPGWFVGNLVNAQWADLPNFDERRDGALLKEIAARAGEAARAAGYADLFLIPSDEPTLERKLVAAEKLLRAAQGVPGVRYGVTANHATFEKLGALHQVSVYDGGAPEEWAAGRKAGRAIWLYDNHATTGFDPAWSRFVYGFLGWRAGFDGVGSWTYPLHIGDWDGRKREDAAGRKIPECDLSGQPINPIVWEAVREGIDDRRYLDGLAEEIERARNAGRAAEAGAAQALLDELRGELPPDLASFGYIQTERGAPSPGRFGARWMDAARQRLAEARQKLAGP
ncbi:MAG: hypothetical protein M5U26_11365 [Planctomycetota bacterium]|nr:hypothetical protein [Planctomycetota bacterium]